MDIQKNFTRELKTEMRRYAIALKVFERRCMNCPEAGEKYCSDCVVWIKYQKDMKEAEEYNNARCNFRKGMTWI
jgi:hypothetical protein